MSRKTSLRSAYPYGEEKKDDFGVAYSQDKPDSSSNRRSGRKRKSTTMVIQGHTVKTINNYTVTGFNYIHGAYNADEAKPRKKPVQKSNNSSKPRMVAQHVNDRHKHNGVVKDLMAKDDIARRNYMTDMMSILEPFAEPKIMDSLHHNQKRMKRAVCPAKKSAENFKLSQQPDIVTTEMRDYQMVGLEWMGKMHMRGMPMILADEMGLGKTLQTISLIAHLKEEQLTPQGPSLVICPLSVLYSWCNEVEKHAPSLKYFRLHASEPKEKLMQKVTLTKDILQYDIVVTTYEMVRSKEILSLIRGTYFNFCVLDEGHVIKCKETQIAEFVRKIHSQNKLILTGTPLQNNLVELYAILNYLYPDYFTSPDSFEDAFDISNNVIDPDMLLNANKLLEKFMLRRLKEQVEKLMPKKIETKIICPLSSTQKFWYKGFLMNKIESLVELIEQDREEVGPNKANELRHLVMQLRKCCLHPYLFDFAEGPDIDNTSVEELIATSGKLAVLDMVLRSMFQKGNRTVIFSQFTSMLDILEDYCILREWKYVRFDGSTPRAQRNHLINQFNAPGSDDFIFLMSTRSGGLGINLQTADTCILYDSDWNPQPDLQAMARVHRIGQKKTVHVYRLVSGGTIEERMLERATKKLYLDQMVNRGASSESVDNDGTGMSTAELLASLKFGSNAIFKSLNELPTADDIAHLTDRNRSESTSTGMLTGGVTKSAKDFELDKELTDTREFDGVNFRALLAEKEERLKSDGTKKSVFLKKLKQEWKEAKIDPEEELGRGKRARKSRILQVKNNGSGYGSSYVPVLALNDYDLMDGEPSVFRETKKFAPVKKKEVLKFLNQDFCQVCGYGEDLMKCPRCPISVHSRCCGLLHNHFQSCSHHRCSMCNKSAAAAGGLIYPCQSCPSAYCPDCLPNNDEVRFIGSQLPRFEDLGYISKPLYHYIHCSKQCEEVARMEFGFTGREIAPTLPEEIDTSYAFGANALSVKKLAKKFKRGNEICIEPQSAKSPKKSRSKPQAAKSPKKSVSVPEVIVLESSDEERPRKSPKKSSRPLRRSPRKSGGSVIYIN